jgi:hypothetical protein
MVVVAMKRLAATLSLGLAIAAGARPAVANGRYPAAKTVAVRKGTDQDMVLGLTIGLAITHDGGSHWYWTCEDNVGYGGIEDPSYQLSAEDGTIFAATYHEGLRVSRDGGCSFESAPLVTSGDSRLNKRWVSSIDLASDGALWATTEDSGLENAVYRSHDKARTFDLVALRSGTAWWNTVKVAPSNPDIVYVTGYQVAPTPAIFFERSTDSGQSWVTIPFPPTFQYDTGNHIQLLGVDPTDPDVVFLASVRGEQGRNDDTLDTGLIGDRVYRSANGGGTWVDVLDTTAPITGFTITGAGDVLVEESSAMRGALQDPPPRGPSCLRRSTDGGKTFAACEAGPAPMYELGDHMHCLATRDDGSVVGCGHNWDPDKYLVGTSSDARSWAGMLRLNEITGPLSCPHGTLQRDRCEALLWPNIAEMYGIRGDATPDAGVAGDDAGSGGGCCDAGADGVGVVVIALVVGGLLFWRGRRKKKDCCR